MLIVWTTNGEATIVFQDRFWYESSKDVVQNKSTRLRHNDIRFFEKKKTSHSGSSTPQSGSIINW